MASVQGIGGVFIDGIDAKRLAGWYQEALGIEWVLGGLRARGVTVEDKNLVWERGKDAWINDLDGNRIELYKEMIPKDSVDI